MEWKKVVSMEYGKIVFHSISYHARVVECHLYGDTTKTINNLTALHVFAKLLRSMTAAFIH